VEGKWSHLLLDGTKAEETRRYSLPDHAPNLIGRRIWLMATNGEPGVPSLGNRVPAAHPGATLVGWVTFSGVIRYTDRAAWAAAEPRHLVPDDDGPYGWKDDGVGKFGWIVNERCKLSAPVPLPAARRQNNSIFRLECTDAELDEMVGATEMRIANETG